MQVSREQVFYYRTDVIDVRGFKTHIIMCVPAGVHLA